MAHYPKLTQLIPAPPVESWARVIDYLIGVWLDDYASTGKPDIVETQAQGFSYLFDIDAGRLLAAWGVSQGKFTDPRDKARMAGHPLSDGPHYHRGHAIPHTLGGPTDINLVPQLGSVNVGAFRILEKEAVATPGSLYFTYWSYRGAPPVAGGPSQRPTSVDQGLLIPGEAAKIRQHPN